MIEPPFVVRERELGLFRLRAALDLAGLQEKKVVIVRMLAAHDIAGLKDHNKNTQQPRHFRWQNLATRSEIRERERERENHAPAQRFSVSKSSRHSAVNESCERDFFYFYFSYFCISVSKTRDTLNEFCGERLILGVLFLFLKFSIFDVKFFQCSRHSAVMNPAKETFFFATFRCQRILRKRLCIGVHTCILYIYIYIYIHICTSFGDLILEYTYAWY